MKRSAFAAVVLLAAAGQAWAADLPVPPAPPPQAPAAYVAPVYNWGGIYFGINAGYGFGNSNWTTGAATTGNFNITGPVAGGTIGGNLQFDSFVIGVEGDFDGAWLDGKSSLCTPVNCETKDSWLATARVRLGFAVDRVLLYGTGGGAFGDIQGNTSGTTFQHKTEPGWTAGAGIEAAFTDNLTARVEYLFVDLKNGTFPTLLAPSTIIKFDANLIRFGVDYKFR